MMTFILVHHKSTILQEIILGNFKQEVENQSNWHWRGGHDWYSQRRRSSQEVFRHVREKNLKSRYWCLCIINMSFLRGLTSSPEFKMTCLGYRPLSALLEIANKMGFIKQTTK
jgi:hypothetical protein